jgi:phage baseplate assembly protein W
MSGFSPKLPLHKSANDGFYGLTKTHIEVIRQNLKNLILTIPGERIMIPNFGVGLQKLLFEQQSESLYSDMSSRIIEQVQIYMSFVEINDVEFIDSERRWTLSSGSEPLSDKYLSQNDPGLNSVNIRILFSVPVINERSVLSFRV